MRTFMRALRDLVLAMVVTIAPPLCLALPPLFAFCAVTALLGGMSWLFILRFPAPRRLRRLATLRLRPPATCIRVIAMLSPFAIAFMAAFNIVYVTAIGAQTAAAAAQKQLGATSAQLLSAVVFAALASPLMEELLFRGWMQSRLQRRWGMHAAVFTTALLFGVSHSFAAPLLVLPFVNGLVFGYAVAVTRSIWAGVALHVGWNTIAAVAAYTGHMVGGTVAAPMDVRLPLVVLAISAPVLVLTLRAAREARRHDARCRRKQSPAARLHQAAR